MSWDFTEWTVPFKTVKIHLHSKPRSLTVPEWILSRLRWAHSQVVHTWTNSPSWLPLVASEFPVFHKGKAVQRSSGYLWAPHWAKLSTPTTNLRTRFGKRWERWSAGMMGIFSSRVKFVECSQLWRERTRNFCQIEIQATLDGSKAKWYSVAICDFLCCHCRNASGKHKYHKTQTRPCIARRPNRLVERWENIDRTWQGLFIYPPPRIAIKLYQAHLQTAVLTHLSQSGWIGRCC